MVGITSKNHGFCLWCVRANVEVVYCVTSHVERVFCPMVWYFKHQRLWQLSFSVMIHRGMPVIFERIRSQYNGALPEPKREDSRN